MRESQAARAWPERQLRPETHPGTKDMTSEERDLLLDKLGMQFGYTMPQHQETSRSETATTSVSKKTTPSTSMSSTSCALRKKIGQTRELQRRHSDGDGRPDATKNLQMGFDREEMQGPPRMKATGTWPTSARTPWAPSPMTPSS